MGSVALARPRGLATPASRENGNARTLASEGESSGEWDQVEYLERLVEARLEGTTPRPWPSLHELVR